MFDTPKPVFGELGIRSQNRRHFTLSIIVDGVSRRTYYIHFTDLKSRIFTIDNNNV